MAAKFFLLSSISWIFAFILGACTVLDNGSVSQTEVFTESKPIEVSPAAELPHASCDRDNVQCALGRMPSAELLEELRQKTGALVVRILQPNQPISPEFDPTRVSVHLNANYVIREVLCF